MYFNFDDRHPDYEGIDRAMSPREGFLLSVLVNVLLLLAVIFLPALLPATTPETLALRQEIAEAREREANSRRFVFVQPRAEFEAKQPPLMPQLSDRDRSAQAPERAPNPTNMMPFSRGNTQELTDAPGAPAPPQPEPPQPAPPESGGSRGDSSGAPGFQQNDQAGSLLRGLRGPNARLGDGGNSGLGDRLGEALRNVQRYYAADQVFDNPGGGGGQFGSAIQFDTKGVEFGPWIRRFIAQIKRNWFVPYAAMSLRGHVVLTFNVHKDGSITDLAVAGASPVESFNNAAFNAVAASNPTQALPPEYPSERAFFTVTFYYNESPPR